MSAAAPALVRLPVWRARFVMAGLVAAFAVLAGRSLYLQAMQTEFLQEKGEQRYSRVLQVPGTRGRILDRNGEALAISTPVQSVWAIPGDVEASAAQLGRLAALLGTDVRELRRKLADRARDFVYLKRQIAPETAEKVARLGLNGILQHREFRRYYPGGEVTAHLVGFTGVDETGQEGLELAYEKSLGGTPGSRRVIKDRRGHVVEDVGSVQPAQDGHDLVLSIDGKIQSLAYAALKNAVAAHKAKAGALVAIDVRTGEVLALANAPSFNPNNRARLAGGQLRNRALTDEFEPGSTLKPFTVALALESGQLSPGSAVHIGSGGLRIANYTIHDPHPQTVLSVAQVIQKSSNVGAARIALAMRREDMWSMFHRAGFGVSPGLDFPGESAGKLRAADSWRPIEQATMAYGHGISVSLLQLARAYTMFARDGELVPATLLKAGVPAAGTRVLSARTARQVRAMLELAVQPGGTAPRARIMGWRVAGKTGTAHKQENGGYSTEKYIASFVGLAPVSEPRLVVAVMIDEPADGQYFGGVVAAPVFAEVMRGALRALGVPYDAPLEPVPLPDAGDEAREST
ncbi:MAG: penicillin-binding protein 2 [Betaproteobacteria bacterium]|nr:penicillin-binding protein 2 [Betaproteobacteria bacterium]